MLVIVRRQASKRPEVSCAQPGAESSQGSPESRTAQSTRDQLLAMAEALFDEDSLRELFGNGSPPANTDNVAARTDVEALSFDWLRRGGKRFRPFITLGAFTAASNGHAQRYLRENAFPLAVRQVAAATEVLHKASLTHDDIEDGDLYRYGSRALYRREGIPIAINVGDHLVSLGYGLVCAAAEALGPVCAQDILTHLAAAHADLCRGQGAELLLRNRSPQTITSMDMREIYALKTSPPFEVALYGGVRMVRQRRIPVDGIRKFSRQLGIGYQALNDLKDWEPDEGDKVVAGQDLLSDRPTLVRAFAWELSDESGRRQLRRLASEIRRGSTRLDRLRDHYAACGAFEKTWQVISDCRASSLVEAGQIDPPPLGEFMRGLVDLVLESSAQNGAVHV